MSCSFTTWTTSAIHYTYKRAVFIAVHVPHVNNVWLQADLISSTRGCTNRTTVLNHQTQQQVLTREVIKTSEDALLPRFAKAFEQAGHFSRFL